MEYYGNKLCISYHELVDSGIMTEPNYKYKAWKGQIDVVRRGGGANGCCVERPLCFAPFGQTGFAPVGHNIIAPCKVLVQGLILFYPFRHSGFS